MFGRPGCHGSRMLFGSGQVLQFGLWRRRGELCPGTIELVASPDSLDVSLILRRPHFPFQVPGPLPDRGRKLEFSDHDRLRAPFYEQFQEPASPRAKGLTLTSRGVEKYVVGRIELPDPKENAHLPVAANSLRTILGIELPEVADSTSNELSSHLLLSLNAEPESLPDPFQIPSISSGFPPAIRLWLDY